MGLGDKLAHAWNAFTQVEDDEFSRSFATATSYGGINPGRLRPSFTNERSIVTSIYARLAIDFSGIPLRHVRLDDNDRYLEDMPSGLNDCLRVEANIDQGARAFRQDIAMSLFELGVVAVVPIDTTVDITASAGFDINTMRVGTIVRWMPRHVRVNVYNDKTGKREDITLEKTKVAIVENPLFSVMNEPNSTLQRLIRKLNLLDAVDEASSSGKLDLIIQLPYVIKSEARRKQAEDRARDIEVQLRQNKYGIAYTDGTEKITQLNRPAENNLMGQIEYLVTLLYGQLGLTPEVMNGTADEKTMLNYYNRTIEPLLDAVSEAMKRNFLTKTARTQKQSIEYFRDPFKLVPISQIAEIADKFSRNEILTPNEIRSAIGYKPSGEPKSDKLQNSNMPSPSGSAPQEDPTQEGDSQNGA